MNFHVLNGDALLNRFEATGLEGDVVIARECLIEGDLSGKNLEEFFRARAAYLGHTYGERGGGYEVEVAHQFRKLTSAPPHSSFHLWFGYDLFCATNMWFVLSLLHRLPVKGEVYVVYPSHLSRENVWLDFGTAIPNDLVQCYEQRVLLSERDLALARGLWQCYKEGDLAGLQRLTEVPAPSFPYLKEVVQAHLDRLTVDGAPGRPERVVKELLDEGYTDFGAMFRAFTSRAGVYGFGDAQIKKLWHRLTEAPSL